MATHVMGLSHNKIESVNKVITRWSPKCDSIVPSLSPTGYNLVDGLTGVGLSEIDCM